MNEATQLYLKLRLQGKIKAVPIDAGPIQLMSDASHDDLCEPGYAVYCGKIRAPFYSEEVLPWTGLPYFRDDLFFDFPDNFLFAPKVKP